MDLNKIAIGTLEEFNVIIEIAANSAPIKYEMDKDSGVLVVDRFVGTGMVYPTNYGFIPHTLSEDNDPADVLVVTPFPLVPSCMVKCRAIGVLRMEDESGIDAKILALPTKKSCPIYTNVDSYEQLPVSLIDQIRYFFEHYKGLEQGKWVKVTGWEGVAAAKKEIEDSIRRYVKPTK